MIRILTLTLFILVASSFFIQTPSKHHRDPPPYTESRSRFLIDLAAISHCRNKIVTQWSCALCKKHTNIKNVTYIEDLPASIVGFVGYDESASQIVLSWRGTVDARNWFEDFNFETVSYSPCKGCQIHAGFYDSYRTVSKKTSEAVGKLLKAYPDSTIAVTGHSLGGALSQICALELYREFGEKVKEIHNFGAPRLGNAELAQFTHLKIPITFRVVHNRDIVPHLPPTQFKYLHHPYQVFYNEKMTSFKVCDETGEDKTCSDHLAPDYTFTDHGSYFIPVDEKIC